MLEFGLSISFLICVFGFISVLLWSWNNEDK